MILDAYHTIDELEALRHVYYDNLMKLDEIHRNLAAKCSKLMEKSMDKDIYCLTEITYSSFADIEAAMQKLQDSLRCISSLILKCQAYMEVDYTVNDMFSEAR